jgi:hypothetical protein
MHRKGFSEAYSIAEKAGNNSHAELSKTSGIFQKINESAVELLGRFLVGQVANAFESDEPGIPKISTQRFG